MDYFRDYFDMIPTASKYPKKDLFSVVDRSTIDGRYSIRGVSGENRTLFEPNIQLLYLHYHYLSKISRSYHFIFFF